MNKKQSKNSKFLLYLLHHFRYTISSHILYRRTCKKTPKIITIRLGNVYLVVRFSHTKLHSTHTTPYQDSTTACYDPLYSKLFFCLLQVQSDIEVRSLSMKLLYTLTSGMPGRYIRRYKLSFSRAKHICSAYDRIAHKMKHSANDFFSAKFSMIIIYRNFAQLIQFDVFL